MNGRAAPDRAPSGPGVRGVWRLTTLAEVRNLRAWLAAASAAAGLDEPARYRLGVAVVEAATNAIRHGRAGGIGEAVVQCECDGAELKVRVIDSGRGFDPDAVRPPGPEELSESGYGLALIRGLADRVELRSRPGEGTVVTINMTVPPAARRPGPC